MQANNGKITAAFIQQFHTGYEIAAQQKLSRLEACVTPRGKITGSSFTINDMGAVEMTDRPSTNRMGATVWSVPDSGTRVALMQDADLYIPIDSQDVNKLLAQPQGPYRDLMIAAANRKKDQIIFNSLIGTIGRKTADNPTGGTALTDTALPAAQKITASAANGIGKDDLVMLKSLFRANECDEENGEQLFIAYNSTMLASILGDGTLTSADFMAVKMLQEGAVATKWLGFTWIPFERLSKDTTAKTITTAAWCKSGLHFGTGQNPVIDIGIRRDRSLTTQLSLQTSYGAGRSNETKVATLTFK
ncbi:hypothetical protein BEE12_16065 [Pantoea agglomerans]|nr:hypothetical protein BEE12_16065 [Pantoea agglomerans]